MGTNLIKSFYRAAETGYKRSAEHHHPPAGVHSAHMSQSLTHSKNSGILKVLMNFEQTLSGS